MGPSVCTFAQVIAFATLSVASYRHGTRMVREDTIAAGSSQLLPWVLTPLPLGSIKPNGWLNDQLQLMSAGLAGHEHDFYNYVAHSSWLGGDMEYSDLNEGFPYWLNGIVPLAYSIDDERLKEQVHSAVQYVLDNQASDGWIGPETGTNRIFWARYPLSMGLTQLVEANSTWEGPIIDAIHRFVVLMNTMLKNNYTGYTYHEGDAIAPGDYQWGQARAPDMILTLQWLYEHYPQENGDLLLENMQYLYDESYKWEAWYNEATYLFQDLWTVSQAYTNQTYQYIHGVNVGQGLKGAAVIRRFTHNSSLVTTAMNGVNWTFTYHGAASGTVLADEREDGLSPYSGSELCTAVETMYSLSYLYQSLGNGYYADRAELAAFNALPAMLTPHWWARQYMEQPNQPYSINLTETPFYNVKTWGQTFGLEPNYPCCTVNHPQGFPKFLSATFAAVGANGLAHSLLSPATASVSLAKGDVTVACTTNYPFAHRLFYTITSTTPFDFYIRVPAWYDPSATHISLNSGHATNVNPDPTTGLHRIAIPAGTTNLEYHLHSPIRVESRANATVAVYHGPLLYALEVTAATSSTLPKRYDNWTEYPANYAPPESRDWIMTNTSAWNVAIDASTLTLHWEPNHDTTPLANPIFADRSPPVWMTALACEINWPLFMGSVPGAAPPVEGRVCLGNTFTARLVPYASAKLHMAELPTVDLTETVFGEFKCRRTWASWESLRNAIQEGRADAVVSLVDSAGIAMQLKLVEAAVQAGVKRFIPSEFGGDSINERVKMLPIFNTKVPTLDLLQAKAEEGKMEWTATMTGPLLDYCLKAGLFGFQPGSKTATIYDGGNDRFSTTTLPDAAKAVVAVLQNPSATRNRAVYVYTGGITQRELLSAVQEVSGETFTVSEVSTATFEQQGREALQRGDMSGRRMLLVAVVFGQGYGSDFAGHEDNTLLGIRPVDGESELVELVRQIYQ